MGNKPSACGIKKQSPSTTLRTAKACPLHGSSKYLILLSVLMWFYECIRHRQTPELVNLDLDSSELPEQNPFTYISILGKSDLFPCHKWCLASAVQPLLLAGSWNRPLSSTRQRLSSATDTKHQISSPSQFPKQSPRFLSVERTFIPLL